MAVDYSGHVPDDDTPKPDPLAEALAVQMDIVKLAYQNGYHAGYAQAIIDREAK